MAELSTPPVECPEAQLAAVLLEGGEIALGVRLRIALDVLEQAVEDGLAPVRRTTGSRFRLENVRVGGEGVALVAGDGSSDGLAELVWEIVAGKPLGDGAPPALSEASDDVIETISDVVSSALAADAAPAAIADFAAAFEEAGRGYTDTHEDVRHALGLDRSEVEPVSVSVAPPDAARTSEDAPAEADAKAPEPDRDAASAPADSPTGDVRSAAAAASVESLSASSATTGVVSDASPKEADAAPKESDAAPKQADAASQPSDAAPSDGAAAATTTNGASAPSPVIAAASDVQDAAPRPLLAVPAVDPLAPEKQQEGSVPHLDGDEDLEPTRVRESPFDQLLEGWEPPDTSRPSRQADSKVRVVSSRPASQDFEPPPSGPSGLPSFAEPSDDEMTQTMDEPTQVVRTNPPRALRARAAEHLLAVDSTKVGTTQTSGNAGTSLAVGNLGAPRADEASVDAPPSAPRVVFEPLPRLDEDDELHDEGTDEEMTRRLDRDDPLLQDLAPQGQGEVDSPAAVDPPAAVALAVQPAAHGGDAPHPDESAEAHPDRVEDPATPIGELGELSDGVEGRADSRDSEPVISVRPADSAGSERAVMVGPRTEEGDGTVPPPPPPLRRRANSGASIGRPIDKPTPAVSDTSPAPQERPPMSARRERVFVLVLATICLVAIGVAAVTAMRAQRSAPEEVVEPSGR